MSDIRRLHIGGLFTGVLENDLRDRFGKFGEVDKIDIITRNDGEIKTFAYLDIKLNDDSLRKCFNVYNKSKWKGNVINVQLAKESYFQKLAREREELLQNKDSINESAKSINYIRKDLTPQNIYGKHIVFNDDPKQNDNELFDVNRPIFKKKSDNSLITQTNRSSEHFENQDKTISTKKMSHLKKDSRKNIKKHILLDNDVEKDESDSFQLAKKSYNTHSVSLHTGRNNVINKAKEFLGGKGDYRKRDISSEDVQSQMEIKRKKYSEENVTKNNDTTYKKSNGFIKPVRYDPSRLDHKIYEISKPEQNLIESGFKNQENNCKKNLIKVDEIVALKSDNVKDKDRFWVVNENLKDSFTNSTKFSFTAMFDIIKDTAFSMEEEKIDKPSFVSSKSIWDEDNFKHDSYSKDEKNQIHILPEQNTFEITKTVKPFFFSENESRIKNGFDFFKKTDKLIVKENWTEQRNLLVGEYRKKKKQLLRHISVRGKKQGHWQLQSKRNRQRWNKKE